MRSGVPLHELRREVLIEAGLSAEPGHSAFSKDQIDLQINRIERMMAQEDEWPSQHYEVEVSVPADAKWVTLPATITPASIRDIRVSFGQEWLPVNQGIGPAERSIYRDDMRSSPTARIEFNVDRPGEFEVWPRSSRIETLLFAGTRAIGAMREENDVCTLDADVIVLRVAAQILGRDQQEDAALKMQQAMSHTQSVLKGINVTKQRANFGARRHGRTWRPGIDFIAPGSG